jgi:ferritin-like metal-binding protein YciE
MEQLLNLRHLLKHEIEDLYSAEEQIIEALPMMVEKATTPELKKSLEEHLRVTKEQKKRLDKVQQLLLKGEDEEPQSSKSFLEKIFGSTKCKGMEGLITEGEKMLKADMDSQVRDAAIIASAQKIEHYEISGYGTARAFANQLSLAEIERLLQTTLNEEYKADDILSVLALKKVNASAEEGEMRMAGNNTNGSSMQARGKNGASSNGSSRNSSNGKSSKSNSSGLSKSGSSNGSKSGSSNGSKSGSSKSTSSANNKGQSGSKSTKKSPQGKAGKKSAKKKTSSR